MAVLGINSQLVIQIAELSEVKRVAESEELKRCQEEVESLKKEMAQFREEMPQLKKVVAENSASFETKFRNVEEKVQSLATSCNQRADNLEGRILDLQPFASKLSLLLNYSHKIIFFIIYVVIIIFPF